MNTFSNTLFSAVERLSGRSGLLTRLVDALIDRIAPQVTAQASCPPAGYVYCGSVCDYQDCCASCNYLPRSLAYVYFAPNYSACEYSYAHCTSCIC